MIPLSFLFDVWNHSCAEGDIVFLSTKLGGAKASFKDHSFTYNKELRREIREWFSRYDSKKYDIYFCPLPFTGKRRKKGLVKEVNLLWSDIDAGNPKIKPSILWESSPGRLQGLWFLNQSMNPEDGAELNKALTYYMDADRGGWDLTQVLRVPGTHNHKYKTLPEVRILDKLLDKIYSPTKLAKKLGMSDQIEESVIPDLGATAEQILSKYLRRIPNKVKRLLAQKHVTASTDRSDIIWYIENKLSEVGMSPPEIITIIKNSVWNKYRGRADEDERLRTEMVKIVESHLDQPIESVVDKTVDEEVSVGLIVESYEEVLSSIDSTPGWLVKGFWMNQSHGIVAGEPKAFKSTLALDLAVSVASGKDFLGKYEVINPGPVIYIQNENAKWIIKDRIMKMAASKGLTGNIRTENSGIYSIDWAPNIPLFMINQQSFLLTDPLHQRILEKIFQEYKPILIILDPLYLMFDGDVNSAKDLNPMLSWLLEMRYKYKCGIMLIHHYNKGSGSNTTSRGGQRMLGSTTLHGWIESAWYISVDPNQDEDDEEDDEEMSKHQTTAGVILDREFRGAGLHPKLDLTIEMGELGVFEYSVQIEKHYRRDDTKTMEQNNRQSPKDIKNQILGIIRTHKVGIKSAELIKEHGFNMKQVRIAVDQLTSEGTVERKGPVIHYLHGDKNNV